MIELSKQFVCINIDSKKGGDAGKLLKQYDVRYVPDVRILSPDGGEILDCSFTRNRKNNSQMYDPKWLAKQMEEAAKKHPGKKENGDKNDECPSGKPY